MSRWSTADIPDQTGRVAVVTGANTGLGLETVKALAARGARTVLAVRDTAKGEAAAATIRAQAPSAEVDVQSLDLASLESVRAAAASIGAAHPRIDLLINNAGVMYTPRQITRDGFELQFGVNHLGHFALTGLLLDRLLATEGSRVVTLSSVGHRVGARIRFEDLAWERTYSRHGAYAQAKLANLMFTYDLQRRLAGQGSSTASVAAHPGFARTELTRNVATPMKIVTWLSEPVYQSAQAGALPTLRAATDPGVLGGQYFGPGGPGELRGSPVVVTSTDGSYRRDVAERLWSVSEDLTGVRYL